MSDRISKDSGVGNAEFFEHDNLDAWTQGIIDDLTDKNKKQAEFKGLSIIAVNKSKNGLNKVFKPFYLWQGHKDLNPGHVVLEVVSD